MDRWKWVNFIRLQYFDFAYNSRIKRLNLKPSMTVTQKVTQHWRYQLLEKVTSYSYFQAKVTRYFCNALLPSTDYGAL